MRITTVRAVRPAIGFANTFSFGSIDRREPFNVLVEIETDDGLVGVGEACPVPAFTAETPQSVAAALDGPVAEVLIGSDPRLVRSLLRQVRTVAEGPFTTAAVDMAMWDLLGQSLDAPVHALLGGARRQIVPQHGSVGMGAADQMVATARDQVAQGYDMLKLYAGREALDDDLARVHAVHDAVGPHVSILLDVNGRWDQRQCARALPALADAGVTILEQPLPAKDLAGMASVTTLSEQFSIEVMADESVFTPTDVATIAQHGAAHVVNLGLSKLGGLLNAYDCGLVAAASGLRVAVGSVLELGVASAAGLHLSAALPDLAAPSYLIGPLKYTEQITDPEVVVTDAAIAVPQGPGLGIRVRSV